MGGGGGFTGLVERKRRAEIESLRPPAETRAPSLSEQAIQDAILAERARMLTGNSRRRAFVAGTAIEGQRVGRTSILGM